VEVSEELRTSLHADEARLSPALEAAAGRNEREIYRRKLAWHASAAGGDAGR